jgi:hypothetical protein
MNGLDHDAYENNLKPAEFPAFTARLWLPAALFPLAVLLQRQHVGL